ncbi:MAG: AAA family ATPase [Gammaproteobacteria bacterium]
MNGPGGEGRRPRMVEDLCRPQAWPHPADQVRLVETHISWVFLAGDFAYKLKKPLDLGFLDFRDRDRRLFFCNEEVRLNRRLAPELYLEVTGAAEGAEGWRMGPLTPKAEPAVKMRRFPDAAQLDRQLKAGQLDAADLEGFAAELADFHAEAPKAPSDGDLGSPQAVIGPALENFRQLSKATLDRELRDQVASLEDWTRTQARLLTESFAARLADGWVRECHGDLHLANLVRLQGRIAAFDGIEFDPALRWIDVISDAAFLLMDTESRGRADLGWAFLNAWLERLGGHEGCALLPWYLAYRHLVRAKVDGIRLTQDAGDEADGLRQRIARHVSLAVKRAHHPPPLLVLMSGYSGSGKTHVARQLAPALGAIRLRSDVERKRLHGVDPSEDRAAPPGEGLYSKAATERTYARLESVAGAVLGAGVPVILDAAFLAADRRRHFVGMAGGYGAVPVILRCQAAPAVLRDRVAGREGDASDAGLAVLADQMRRYPPPGDDEVYRVETVRTDAAPDIQALARRLTDREA